MVLGGEQGGSLAGGGRWWSRCCGPMGTGWLVVAVSSWISVHHRPRHAAGPGAPRSQQPSPSPILPPAVSAACGAGRAPGSRAIESVNRKRMRYSCIGQRRAGTHLSASSGASASASAAPSCTAHSAAASSCAGGTSWLPPARAAQRAPTRSPPPAPRRPTTARTWQQSRIECQQETVCGLRSICIGQQRAGTHLSASNGTSASASAAPSCTAHSAAASSCAAATHA